jgi:hypothetical protein
VLLVGAFAALLMRRSPVVEPPEPEPVPAGTAG